MLHPVQTTHQLAAGRAVAHYNSLGCIPIKQYRLTGVVLIFIGVQRTREEVGDGRIAVVCVACTCPCPYGDVAI